MDGTAFDVPILLMTRPLTLLLFPVLVTLPAFAAEWDDLRAQYQTVSVVAGLGVANGDNNPNEWNAVEGQSALAAELSEPHFATEDIYGRILVADKNAHAIRRIDLDGTIHTVAGVNLEDVSGMVTNAGFNGDGPARQCLLNGPQAVCPLPDGSFYFGDSINRRIRRVDPSGNLTTVITDPDILSRGLWVRRDHQEIYYCTVTTGATASLLRRWTPANGNGPGVVVASGFVEAGNIDRDAAGNIYVSDRELHGVYRIPANYGGGAITDSLRVAGLGNRITTDSGPALNGQPATSVGMRGARGVAFHPLGGYFVATHRGGDVWYVDSGGLAWMFVQGDNGITHFGSPAAVPTSFLVMSEPRSVSVSWSGNVLIACNDAGYVRIVRNVLPKPAAPVIESLTLVPAGVRLRWQSDPSLWYYLEQNPSLAADAWSPLSALPATGTLTEFTDPAAATSARKFYRLRSLRAWPN
jgi:hypothetical protein